jgi:hypothetical protein
LHDKTLEHALAQAVRHALEESSSRPGCAVMSRPTPRRARQAASCCARGVPPAPGPPARPSRTARMLPGPPSRSLAWAAGRQHALRMHQCRRTQTLLERVMGAREETLKRQSRRLCSMHTLDKHFTACMPGRQM